MLEIWFFPYEVGRPLFSSHCRISGSEGCIKTYRYWVQKTPLVLFIVTIFNNCDKISQCGENTQREEQCRLAHCFEGFVSQSHGTTAGSVESQDSMAIRLCNHMLVGKQRETYRKGTCTRHTCQKFVPSD